MDAINLTHAAVLVTGGARGIGRATAEEFVKRGARVAIGDIDGDATVEAAAEIGERAHGFGLDVADQASFAAFVADAEEAVGPPDVLVNNAGVMPLGPFVEEDDATSRRTIEVNLGGVIQGMRLVLGGMVERGSGHVVNVASMMGKLHVPGAAVYGATKHAVVGLGAAVREELDGTGVTVTTVLPAAVRTELVAGVPLGRGLPTVGPEKVARAVVEACDDRPAEVHVPGWLAAYETTMALAPSPLVGAVRRLLGSDRVMTRLDEEERAAYERRIRDEQ